MFSIDASFIWDVASEVGIETAGLLQYSFIEILGTPSFPKPTFSAF